MFQIKKFEKEEKHYFIENKEELELLNNSIEKKGKELKILKLKNENLKKEKNQLEIIVKNYHMKKIINLIFQLKKIKVNFIYIFIIFIKYVYK